MASRAKPGIGDPGGRPTSNGKTPSRAVACSSSGPRNCDQVQRGYAADAHAAATLYAVAALINDVAPDPSGSSAASPQRWGWAAGW